VAVTHLRSHGSSVCSPRYGVLNNKAAEPIAYDPYTKITHGLATPAARAITYSSAADLIRGLVRVECSRALAHPSGNSY
jgi:hypothetical protein